MELSIPEMDLVDVFLKTQIPSVLSHGASRFQRYPGKPRFELILHSCDGAFNTCGKNPLCTAKVLQLSVAYCIAPALMAILEIIKLGHRLPDFIKQPNFRLDSTQD